MRRALSVGIDQYEFGVLSGCANDARKVCALLTKHDDGSPNFSCRKLLGRDGSRDGYLTRAALKREVKELFGPPADVAVLHFSGHGAVNDLDGYLMTQDAVDHDEGLAMSEVLKMANESRASEVVILLDCCHSGAFASASVVDNARAMLREGVSILAASRREEASMEASGGGVFTSLLCDALAGGAADVRGDVTAPGVYAFVEAALGAWDQRPLFKSHVSKLVSLRRCRAPVDVTILREMPDLFPTPSSALLLSPEFEPTHPTSELAKVALFRKLQALHRVHLVVPDAPHMYDAAMCSKSCTLTAIGRHYWRLAKNGQL